MNAVIKGRVRSFGQQNQGLRLTVILALTAGACPEQHREEQQSQTRHTPESQQSTIPTNSVNACSD